jgi:hypothetical protein
MKRTDNENLDTEPVNTTLIEGAAESTDPQAPTEDDGSSAPTHGWFRRNILWFLPLSLLVVAGIGGTVWAFALQPAPRATIVNPQTPTPVPTPPPTPVLKASPLTGELVDPALANRPVTSVIIENHTDARPQSGLSQAGVVYEALAEGGITRFQAFFLDKRPATLGPVRSLRTYFLDWGLEFNAPVAHAGGNADALVLVTPLGMKDLNALIIGAPSFYRTSDRFAPHNLYTSSDLLDALIAKRGYNTPADFTVSPRKADTPDSIPTHPSIHIDYSYNGYQVDYTYVAATNDYARSLAGAPHIDRNTGAQIHVKNMVVEYMPTSYGTTQIGEQTVIMKTVGQGKALVFRDGDLVVGTWSKASHNARTVLTDATGAEIPLDVGNTWYSIVPIGNNVTY